MGKNVHFGITYPAGQQRHHELGDYVERVETAGYESFWVIDNLGSGSPGLECLTTLAFAGARSTKLKLGTSVMLLALRSPVLVGQACNTIDVLSNGRFILGVGVGDSSSHEGVGADAKQRGARTTEYLALLKQLWAPGKTHFDGTTIKLDGYELTPRCVQTPHPPIWIGAHSPAALSRAAQYADGFIAVGQNPEQAGATFDELDRQAAVLGRKKLTRAVHLYMAFAETPAKTAGSINETLTDRYQRPVDIGDSFTPHFLGTHKDMIETAKKFIDVGVTQFIIDPSGQQSNVMHEVEQFADQCMPEIT